MDEGKLLELFRQVVREELGVSTPEMVGFKEAARRLAVSEPTVRRMVTRGEILSVTISKKPKIPISEIKRITTPSASMPELGQRRQSRAVLTRMKAASLSRKRPGSVEAEIAKLHALRAARKKKR